MFTVFRDIFPLLLMCFVDIGLIVSVWWIYSDGPTIVTGIMTCGACMELASIAMFLDNDYIAAALFMVVGVLCILSGMYRETAKNVWKNHKRLVQEIAAVVFALCLLRAAVYLQLETIPVGVVSRCLILLGITFYGSTELWRHRKNE
ncbi:MAG: hypothetical protein ABI758_01030 [Candidatus Woesebacteria bacterium]